MAKLLTINTALKNAAGVTSAITLGVIAALAGPVGRHKRPAQQIPRRRRPSPSRYSRPTVTSAGSPMGPTSFRSLPVRSPSPSIQRIPLWKTASSIMQRSRILRMRTSNRLSQSLVCRILSSSLGRAKNCGSSTGRCLREGRSFRGNRAAGPWRSRLPTLCGESGVLFAAAE